MIDCPARFPKYRHQSISYYPSK